MLQHGWKAEYRMPKKDVAAAGDNVAFKGGSYPLVLKTAAQKPHLHIVYALHLPRAD